MKEYYTWLTPASTHYVNFKLQVGSYSMIVTGFHTGQETGLDAINKAATMAAESLLDDEASASWILINKNKEKLVVRWDKESGGMSLQEWFNSMCVKAEIILVDSVG